MRKGSSVEEMLAAGITGEFDAKWGANRERFVAQRLQRALVGREAQ